jgi:N-acetylmuramoyl-L-alanine amidase
MPLHRLNIAPTVRTMPLAAALRNAFSLVVFFTIAIAQASAQGMGEGGKSGDMKIVKVHGMRLVGDKTRTRLVVDLDSPPEHGILHLTDPYRLVIDLPRVIFTSPAARTDGRGLIADYRFGLIAPEKARIVLDLTGPVAIAKTFLLPAAGKQPVRLVFDFVSASPESFAAAAAADNTKTNAAATGDASKGDRLRGSSPGGRPIVVIDPGHGGIDSGAAGAKGVLEKAVTLEFALELATRLQAGGRVDPVLTRNSDKFLSLRQRIAIARNNRAALMISVHADTVPEEYVRGATVYTLSEKASDSLSAALAARENRSDILAGMAIDDQPDEVADILFDLARRESRNLSLRFAKGLVKDMSAVVKLNNSPWRRAAFQVLKAPDIPSVLLELGFLSNSYDEQLLRSSIWRKRSAEAVASAIELFVGDASPAGIKNDL